VFQRRQREAELIAQGMDSTNQPLYPMAGAAGREEFISDRERFAGDQARPNPKGIAVVARELEG
jgi:hypothetical protein